MLYKPEQKKDIGEATARRLPEYVILVVHRLMMILALLVTAGAHKCSVAKCLFVLWGQDH